MRRGAPWERCLKMKKITSAYINVQDKTGIVDLAAMLVKKGVEVFCPSATLKLLEKNGVTATDASTITGQEKTLDGAVDGLSQALFAGFLAERKDSAHTEQLKSMGARRLDLLIANPVPFEVQDDVHDLASKKNPLDTMDVSAISQMRAAAKNYKNVAVLCSPDQYSEFTEEFSKNDGSLKPDYMMKLALRVFELTAEYESTIYKYLSKLANKDEFLPETLFLSYKKAFDLKYGENPHQKAVFYKVPDLYGVSIAEAELHKGAALTYDLAYDLDLALEIVMEFDKPAVAVVKQGVPLGVALDKDLTRAYIRARDVEPASAVGAVVAFNGQLEKRGAKELTSTYNEAVIASRYTDGALDHLKSAKKSTNMRVLQIAGKKWTKQAGTLNVRSMLGGVIVQENDDLLLPEGTHLKVLSKRKPTRKQLADLILAWKVCKHVGSNSVVLAKDLQTIGTGANQINRMDAMQTALDKAGDNAVGCVMAFDTFIPFRNVVDEAARLGITCIIQPGGALRDDEIAMACDEHNIALGITQMRHTRH